MSDRLLDVIRQKLQALSRRNRRWWRPNERSYGLNPPLSSAQVERWEGTHGVVLPPAYRAFVTTLGDGGYGPYGNVARLSEWCSHLVDDSTDEGRRWPSAAFRYRIPADGANRLVEAPDLSSDLPAHAGTIAVSDDGCGCLSLLILNGELSGRICGLDFPREPYLYPQQNFLEWYDAWLDAERTGERRAFPGA